jgi:hypothetical protein
MQPYVPNVTFDPKWQRLDVDSDIDLDEGTEEITSVLPIQNKGLLVRVSTFVVTGKMKKTRTITSESLAFLPGACVIVETGKETRVVFRRYIGSKGAPGSFTEEIVKETPEFIEEFNQKQAAAAAEEAGD